MDSGANYSSSSLLQALQRFVVLINNPGNIQVQGGSNGVTGANPSKVIPFFLRLHLLGPLRHIQSVGQGERYPHKDVLIQWWVTLLNYLNSDLGPAGTRVGQGINIDSISVALECISRILAILMPSGDSKARDFDIYSHHLLLTVHYVTNRLVDNSKKNKTVSQNLQIQATQMKATLMYIQSYNGLLRSLMGKVIAYAYFFLPNAMNYDIQVLKSLCNAESIHVTLQNQNTMLPWKPLKYELFSTDTNTLPQPSQKGLAANSIDTLTAGSADVRQVPHGDFKIFQVMISYLHNTQVFMAFYWHFWYIVIQLHLSAGQNGALKLDSFPGSKILMNHVANSLNKDILKFSQYKRAHESKESSSLGGLDGSSLPSKANRFPAGLASSKQNTFIYTKFESIKLWECLRSLVGCFKRKKGNEADLLLRALIHEHDKKQLEVISQHSAYDIHLGTLIFNKLLQFIIFQFSGSQKFILSGLYWPKWIEGLQGMLWTLNVNCQSAALMCLFNIWDYIAYPERVLIQSLLVNELWDSLTTGTEFHLVRVLFMKLVVFKVIPDRELNFSCIKERLQLSYLEAVKLSEHVDISKLNFDFKNCFVFNGNRRLVLVANPPVMEEEFILDEKKKHESSNGSSQNFQHMAPVFPFVSSLQNVRPSVVISKGKYPFDIFDEMVNKASLIVAEKKIRAKTEKENMSVNRSISMSSTEDHDLDENGSDNSGSNGAVSTWNSIVSKLSTYNRSLGKSSHPRSASPSQKKSKTVHNFHDLASSDSLDSETGEMLSICSSPSQLSALTYNSVEDSSGHSKRPSTNSHIYSNSKNRSRDSLGNAKSKKRRLLAPPELKYTSEISERKGINHVFRLISNPQVGETGIAASAASKVKDANEKWGIINTSSFSYDKPLPLSPDAPETVNDTLIDGFDFGSLSPPIMDDLCHINGDTPDHSAFISDKRLSTHTIDSGIVPSPHWGPFTAPSSDKSRSSTENDVETFVKGSVTTPKSTSNCTWKDADIQTIISGFNNVVLENKLSTVPSLIPTADQHNPHDPIKLVKHQKTSRMLQTTRIRKLLQLIISYNCTVQEYYEYQNGVKGATELDNIFMEFDVCVQTNRYLRPGKDAPASLLAI